MVDVDYPVIIAGSGIAAYSAAIYAGRAQNNPLVLKGDEPGGQLTLTSEVANYPGFPDGVTGPELMDRTRKQAEKFGADVKSGVVSDIYKDDEKITVVLKNGKEYTSRSLIAATGASARQLGVKGEDEYMGWGLSTCATCDGAFFKDEDMLVVGGGDAALEEASFLTRFADTVYIAHRRDEWRGSSILINEVEEHVKNGDIELLMNTEVVEIVGNGDEVTGVELVYHEEGYPKSKINSDNHEVETTELDIGAVFYAIGHTPNTEYLEETGVELDEEGYIEVQVGEGPMSTQTDVEGIFGAGDVVDSHYQQAATAAGMGVKAALDVDSYLSEEI